MASENGNYVPYGAWRMQMESKGETVDDVVTAVTTFQCEGRIRAERVKLIAADIARRCKEAHEREVKKLIAIIESECRKCGECAKFGKDCAAGDIDGAEDDRACEKFVNKEVAELRECLKEAVESYCTGCNDFIGGKQKCEPCKCKAQKWRKALKGAGK